MSPSDDLDTIIQAIIADAPKPATRPRRPYPALRFLAGTGLVLANATLGYVFVWLLTHG